MKNLIESGEYFKDARIWYNQIFLSPYYLRSSIFIFFVTTFIFMALLIVNVKSLLPLNKQIVYAINVQDSSEFAAKIQSADMLGNDTFKSIAQIFVETYIELREGYNYEGLADRMLFVRTMSTRALFNRYSNYLSLDNPDSPVLKLQKYAKKHVSITKVNFTSSNSAIVVFESISKEDTGKVIEKTTNEAYISFAMDKIDITLPENSPFNFIVSEYKVKQIN
jgi:type IV secretion system protein VirB8